MFYPALASVHAKARYDDLLQEAALERQLKATRKRASLPDAIRTLVALILGAH